MVGHDCRGTYMPMGILVSNPLTMREYQRNNYVAGITPPAFGKVFYGCYLNHTRFDSSHRGPELWFVQATCDRFELCLLLAFHAFVFPAFFEESFFRGLLIPNNAKRRGSKYVLVMSLISSTLFVAWHPLNALTINKGARELFLDPYFLVVGSCLGMARSLSYIYSISLWSPVIIHRLTVVIGVIFLGGRNLILE